MKSVGHPLSSVTPNRMRKNKRKSGKPEESFGTLGGIRHGRREKRRSQLVL